MRIDVKNQHLTQKVDGKISQPLSTISPIKKDACNSPIYFSDNEEESEDIINIVKDVCKSYKKFIKTRTLKDEG